jgi:hypothetical protein
MSNRAVMHIIQCNQTILPTNQQGLICELFAKRIAAIYSAYHCKLSENHWQHQGKYQYIELAHAIIQHHDNTRYLQGCQCIFFIYMSPEFHSSIHLGPAIQHSYQLDSLCYDVIDCHFHALAYALLLSQYKLAHHHQIAIFYLEQAVNKNIYASKHQTTQNSAGMLCLSNQTSKHIPYMYRIAGIYCGEHMAQITEQHPHLNTMRSIAVITNNPDIETTLQNKPTINKVYLCISTGFTNIFLYLHQCLMQPHQPSKHIWVVLHDTTEHTTSFIWIKRC